MNYKQLVHTPLFFGIVHATLTLLVLVFCSYLVSYKTISYKIEKATTELVEQKDLLNIVSTQGNYLQSETYKIKYIKEILGKKLKDEKVIDTTTWEDEDLTSSSYLPSDSVGQLPIQWLDCLTGKDLTCFNFN